MALIPTMPNANANVVNTKYGKFRTPTFSIEVGDARGQGMIPLPTQLLRLVDKIEIQENLGQPVSCLYNQIVITFLEGSREPFEHTSATTKSLYPLGGNDFISNKTGMLPDLELKNQGGILSVTSPTQLLAAAGALASSLGALAGFVSGDNTIDIDNDASVAAGDWLFKENNQVKVTFGYAEDPEGQRSVRGRIKLIQTDFPENDHPKTTITCLGTEADVDKLATAKGVQFANKIPAGLTLTGQPIFTHQDKSIVQILNEVCLAHGVELIISNEFLAKLTDKHSAKVWPAGESFHQFLSKLAGRHNAYYSFIIDPKTGKDTLYFIARPDYDKYLTVGDLNLFAYKQPGSILKSVNIKVDFGGITGAYTSGVNDNGKLVGKGFNTPKSAVALFKDNVLVNTKPEGAAVDAVNGAAIAGKTTGKMEVSPEANSEGNISDKAQSKTACGFSHLVGVEFTCLGYPKLVPGPLLITGLGKRYSGSYKIINVTHILDESGYHCKGMGQGEGLGAGGVTDSEVVETKQNPNGQSVVSLFSAAAAQIPGAGEPRLTLDEKRNKK